MFHDGTLRGQLKLTDEVPWSTIAINRKNTKWPSRRSVHTKVHGRQPGHRSDRARQNRRPMPLLQSRPESGFASWTTHLQQHTMRSDINSHGSRCFVLDVPSEI